MGGTDEPSNIVLLSIEEHAEAHKKLYEEFGKMEDFLAWQGLSRMISKKEIIRLKQSIGGKKRMEKYGHPGKVKKTGGNFSINELSRKKASVLAHSDKAKQKRKNSFDKIKHQQGENNSQYGKKWCVPKNAKDLLNRKKFNIIPEGWITTTEWKENKKDKTNNAYGRHWYNDGIKNYYLKESDSLVSSLTRGRIMVVQPNI